MNPHYSLYYMHLTFIFPLAIEKECLVVRDYYWWPSVRRLYETHTLHWMGSLSNIELYDVLQSLLSPSSFQSNLSVVHLHTVHVLVTTLISSIVGSL